MVCIFFFSFLLRILIRFVLKEVDFEGLMVVFFLRLLFVIFRYKVLFGLIYSWILIWLGWLFRKVYLRELVISLLMMSLSGMVVLIFMGGIWIFISNLIWLILLKEFNKWFVRFMMYFFIFIVVRFLFMYNFWWIKFIDCILFCFLVMVFRVVGLVI